MHGIQFRVQLEISRKVKPKSQTPDLMKMKDREKFNGTT